MSVAEIDVGADQVVPSFFVNVAIPFLLEK